MLAATVAVACALSAVDVSAKSSSCSVAGLKPALQQLKALGGVGCSTARSLPKPALKAAKKQGYNTHALKVHGFTCHVLATKQAPFAGHCTQDHHKAHVVDWRYA